MHDLIGRRFQLDDQDYTIVDIRNIGAETMIYAEPQYNLTKTQRAAFRYADIENLLAEELESLAQVG